MRQKPCVLPPAFLPHRPMLFRDGKIAAGGTDALRSDDRVRASIITQARCAFTAVDAVAPIATTEPHVGFSQDEVHIVRNISVSCTSTEATVRRDRSSGTAGRRYRGQQILKRRPCVVRGLCVDQIGQIEVRPDIAFVGHCSGHVAKVRGKGIEAGTVTSTNKSRKGLSSLMGRQMPRPFVIKRQIYKGCKRSVETVSQHR